MLKFEATLSCDGNYCRKEKLVSGLYESPNRALSKVLSTAKNLGWYTNGLRFCPDHHPEGKRQTP